ncbi:MAG: HD domain-containing phosphohydrolase, partial [Planctomycetota bacterium]
RFKDEYPNIPIVMVTGQDSREDRLRAVEAGADDFIGKPVDMTELRVRVTSQLEKKKAVDQLKAHEAQLEEKVKERTEALRETLDELAESKRAIQDAYVEAINRLARAAEFKDKGTGCHVERVGGCVEVLAQEAGLSPGTVEVFRYASRMHDVGKVGIPDTILLKSSELVGEEWEMMKTHTVLGRRILSGSSSEILQAGEVIAECHHEKWDGSGYPRGLEGKDIPIEGRICALADVFDALISDRPYRPAYPVEKAFSIMEQGRGTHFDPDLFDLFESNLDAIVKAGEAGAK